MLPRPAFRSVVVCLPLLLVFFGAALQPAPVSSGELEDRPSANDGNAQKRTLADIRNTGTAMFSWLTDQVAAAAAGQSQSETPSTRVELKHYQPVSREELEKLLVPQYIKRVPEKDGWGHPYEYYLNVEDPQAEQVMSIRSPGRDGGFSADSYTVGPFNPNDFDEDIVWNDGYFVRWPEAESKDAE